MTLPLERMVRRGVDLGLELAVRSGVAPVLLGLRWASRALLAEFPHAPPPRRSLALLSKVALDELFFATELATAALVSFRERERVQRELHESLRLFEARGWLADPASYHQRPPALARIEREAERFMWLPHLWVPYQHWSFESGYAPHDDEPGRERWLGYEPNRTAHAWVLEHPGPARPWLVCVPGYRMGHPAVDFTGFRARWLHRHLGLNVAIPVLPFHGPRSVGRRGGDGFLTGDFVDTVHAQAQAVWDSRRLIHWLRRERSAQVGVYGISLGSYTVAMLAALEPRLDCVIVGVPAADFLRLLRSHAPPGLLAAASRAGFPVEDVERLLSVVSPLAVEPRVPRERRFLYAGLADRLATPDHAWDLWQHWGRPRLVWYDGSHVSFLWEARVQALLESALAECGLLDPPAAAQTVREKRRVSPALSPR